MDPWLSGIGLNKNTCVKNGFGATFCGDDADAYQKNIADLQSSLGSVGSSSQSGEAALNVRAALPAVEAYYADNNTYGGMSRAKLSRIDNSATLSTEPIVSDDGQRYCIQDSAGGETYSYTGPGIDSMPVPGSC